ncbi:hypothetical protein P3T22_004029 [Paraburkholderia sp. GAS348]
MSMMSILISHFGCHACNTASMRRLFPDSTGCGAVVQIRQAGENRSFFEDLGEGTKDVLQSLLGLSDERLSRLKSDGVV